MGTLIFLKKFNGELKGFVFDISVGNMKYM